MSFRRRSALWSAAVCIVAATFLSTAFRVLLTGQSSELVGAFAFSEANGTATADGSGGGNTGTLMNGVVRIPSGRFGSALTLDGVDDGVRLPANSATLTLTTAFTVEAWVQPTAPHGGIRQIVQTSGTGGEGLRLTAEGRPRFRGIFPTGAIDLTGPTAVPVGQWTHLAATYDGSTLAMYADGALVAAEPAAGGLSGSDRTWFGRTRGGANPFTGALDEIRIYRRALTAAEVALDGITPIDSSTPFQVSRTTPVAQAFGVLTTPVTASFSRPIDATTLTPAAFTLATANITVPASLSYDAASRTATLVPAVPLTRLTTYTARIVAGAGGVRDAGGTLLVADAAWTFQTAADDSAPSAAYAFSENSGLGVFDASGNGHTGTLVAGTARTGDGRYGAGLLFDGSDDGVELPATDALAPHSAFTFDAWVRPAGPLGTPRQIIQTAGENGDGLRLNDDGRPRFSGAFPFGTVTLTAPSVLPLDAWSHVAATYDGALVRLFVDGIQVASEAVTGAMSGALPVWIGRTRQGGRPFIGAIDEVHIHRRALPAAELVYSLSTPVDTDTTFQVSHITPTSGAIGVVTTPVTASFSGQALPSSVTADNFTLEHGGQAAVEATVSYDTASRTATLTPSAPLQPQTTYTARIRGGSGGVLSAASAPLAGDTTWSFATATDSASVSAAYALDDGAGIEAIDASGNGHTGRFVSEPAWVADGRYGGALMFDGVDDGVEVPSSDAMTFTTALTLEAWVRPSADTATLRQIIQLPGETTAGLKLTPSGHARVRVDVPTGPARVTATEPLPLDAWSHVAATYDGSTLRLYVNGVEAGTRATAGDLAGSLPMSIGRSRPGGQAFAGSIDEVRIYRRALTAEEIVADMNAPIGAAAPTSVTITPSALTITTGSTFALSASATYPDGTISDVTPTAVWTSGNDQVATATAGALTGVSTGLVTVTASVSGRSGTATVRVVTPDSVPPSPEAVAPPTDTTIFTPFRTANEFLFTGTDAIQRNVAPATIDPQRAAVVRGRAITRDGAPLPGVTVTVAGRPEFGSTATRDDGAFDLVVNGGGPITLSLAKTGYFGAERQVDATWGSFAVADTAALIPLDPAVTSVDLTIPSVQLARGSAVSDADGTRQATVLFPVGTSATLLMPDGSAQPVGTLHVRATEYTVGPNGEAAMPAPLPPTSAYTYAVELSADEAIASGATAVQFSSTVPVYVENFLGFPVGTSVPSGSYDRTTHAWVASPNGIVLRLLTPDGTGLAELDLDGDDSPDSPSALAALGISDGERVALATTYSPGQTLWRVPVSHFSPHDFNWWAEAAVPEEADSIGPSSRNSNSESSVQSSRCGSIILCQAQTLGEDVPVAGTSFALTYRSDRAIGRETRRSIGVALTPASIPPGLLSITVRTRIAGQEMVQSFAPAPALSATVNWDGKNVYGRPVFGAQLADIEVAYEYNGKYVADDVAPFGVPGGELTFVTARRSVYRRTSLRVELQGAPPPSTAVAGWNVTPHHLFDPIGQILYRGDGRQVRSSARGLIVQHVREEPAGARAAAIGPDGNVYTIGSAGLVRWLPDGTNSVVSPQAPAGDQNVRLVPGPDESWYYAQYKSSPINPELGASVKVGRYERDGTHALLATIPGTSSLDNYPVMAVTPGGAVYVVNGISADDSASIYRVGAGGTSVTKVVSRTPSDGNFIHIGGVGVDRRGAIYWSEYVSVPGSDMFTGQIFRQSPLGIVTHIGGAGEVGNGDDGGPATLRALGPLALTLEPDGTVTFIDVAGDRFFSGTAFSRVRRISPDGVLTTVAGGLDGDSGDNGPAVAGRFKFAASSLLLYGPDGHLYVSDGVTKRLRKVRVDPPQGSATAYSVASEDGAEVYEFDRGGKHLRTRHALTGALIYSFGYDSAGRLISVTDGDDLETTVERDAEGVPSAIVAPFGQHTTLTVDEHGYLATIADPAGNTTTLTTNAGGLLTAFESPNGHASTITYDSLGRLSRDEDAAGGSQEIDRSESSTAVVSTLTTWLGREHTYRVERPASGGERLVNTAPDGSVTTDTLGIDGSRDVVAADGTRTTTVFDPDPRFGLAVAVPRSMIVRTPGGRQMTSATTRTVTLADPADLLSVQSQTETATVNGRTATTVFDAASRTFTATSPAARVSTTSIDAQGRVTRTQVGTLTPVDFAYDPQGRLTTITQGTRTSSIAYDGSGRPASLTDAASRTVGFGYDAADRVATQTLPDTRTIGFGYDANGNVTSLTPPGRPAHTFTYTPVDLTASYTPPALPGAGATTYLFNEDKQPTTLVRPDGLATGFSYDDGGRLEEVTFSRGTLQYTYDAAGRMATLADPGGVGLTFTYDGALPVGEAWSGPVTGAVARTFSNDFGVATETVNDAFAVAFGYDADLLLTQAGDLTVSRDAETGLVTGTAVGATTDTYQYNGFGEATRQTAQSNSATVFDVQILRDDLGRIVQRIEVVDGFTRVFEYGYDPAGRLASVTRNGTLVVQYTYDANGNRLSASGEAGLVEGTYDAQDRLLTYGAASYTYSANGELATRTVGDQTTTYSYDTLGNLITVTKPDATVISYTVDARGRRVRKAVNGVAVKGWLYADQLRPIAELDGSGAVVSRFVYGTKPNVPEYVIKNGETYRIVSDHLGTPRVVVHATTGAVVQRFDVQPFGELIQDSNPGWQPFGFAGGLYDPDTGLVRFGARDYDPYTGQWSAKDPIGFFDGSTDLYDYAFDEPLDNVDPNGLFAVSMTDATARQILMFKEGFVGGMQGLAASVDGAVPFFDPLQSLGAYDERCFGLSFSKTVGGASIQLLLAAGSTPTGWLFGRGGRGLLNSNQYLRIGWGWKGSAKTGKLVFRIAIGSKGLPIHWHLP